MFENVQNHPKSHLLTHTLIVMSVRRPPTTTARASQRWSRCASHCWTPTIHRLSATAHCTEHHWTRAPPLLNHHCKFGHVIRTQCPTSTTGRNMQRYMSMLSTTRRPPSVCATINPISRAIPWPFYQLAIILLVQRAARPNVYLYSDAGFPRCSFNTIFLL